MQVQVKDNLCKFRLSNKLAGILYIWRCRRVGSELLSSLVWVLVTLILKQGAEDSVPNITM